jgi:hypothetical protein
MYVVESFGDWAGMGNASRHMGIWYRCGAVHVCRTREYLGGGMHICTMQGGRGNDLVGWRGDGG